MKTAAVIGARSMLGRELIERLHALDIGTLTVGRSTADDIFFDLESDGNVDCMDLAADTVFHCAASFADDSDGGFRQNFAANAASAINIARLAKKLNAAALVYAGSLSSDETLDVGNFTSYGLTKAIAEQVISWALQKQRVRFCSLRFAQLYDTEGLCCLHQPWFGRIVAYTSRGLDIRMPRSLGPRNFMHVRDAADLMIRAASIEFSGVASVAHPELLTSEQIADMAYGVFDQGGRVVIAEEKAPFRRINFADGGETFDRLELRPAIGMEVGIRLIRDAGTSNAFGPMDIT